MLSLSMTTIKNFTVIFALCIGVVGYVFFFHPWGLSIGERRPRRSFATTQTQSSFPVIDPSLSDKFQGLLDGAGNVWNFWFSVNNASTTETSTWTATTDSTRVTDESAGATASQQPTETSPTPSQIPVRNCHVAANTYQHREQIPRPDPCELCVCVDSEMYCLWRLCPPPAATTTTAPRINNNTQVEMEFTQLITQQREFNAIQEKQRQLQTTASVPTSTDPTSCYVMGVRYRLGEILPRDTGTCLECSCAEGARVTCTPKDCASQPDIDYMQHSNSLDMFDLDTF